MVSHQLVYVTGMLEVILAPSGAGNLAWYPAILAGVPDAPSDPSGGCGRLRSFPGTRHAWPASLTAPSDSSGRLRPPAKSSWYLAILASVPDGPFRPLGAAAAACEVFLVPGNLGQRP